MPLSTACMPLSTACMPLSTVCLPLSTACMPLSTAYATLHCVHATLHCVHARHFRGEWRSIPCVCSAAWPNGASKPPVSHTHTHTPYHAHTHSQTQKHTHTTDNSKQERASEYLTQEKHIKTEGRVLAIALNVWSVSHFNSVAHSHTHSKHEVTLSLTHKHTGTR